VSGPTHPRKGWHSGALSIASYELDQVRDWLESALGMVEDSLQQVEDADKAFQATDAPHEVFWIQFSDCGQHIRQWSRLPFEGARKCRVEIAAEQVSAMTVPERHAGLSHQGCDVPERVSSDGPARELTRPRNTPASSGAAS